MDGEVRLDGVCAVARMAERRFVALALLPQIPTHAVAYLIIDDVRNKEIGVPVVNSACYVLYAQPFPSAFKQNLNNVPMVDVFHSAKLHFSLQRYKKNEERGMKNEEFATALIKYRL